MSRSKRMVLARCRGICHKASGLARRDGDIPYQTSLQVLFSPFYNSSNGDGTVFFFADYLKDFARLSRQAGTVTALLWRMKGPP